MIDRTETFDTKPRSRFEQGNELVLRYPPSMKYVAVELIRPDGSRVMLSYHESRDLALDEICRLLGHGKYRFDPEADERFARELGLAG
jgi:hypothetical protein